MDLIVADFGIPVPPYPQQTNLRVYFCSIEAVSKGPNISNSFRVRLSARSRATVKNGGQGIVAIVPAPESATTCSEG